MPEIPNPESVRTGVEDRTHRLRLLRTPLLRSDTASRISFGDFLYGSAQRIILKIEVHHFLDARQWMKAELTGCPTVQGRPQRVESRPRTVSGCRRLSFRMASANFETAGSSRVIQSE
jgi:hypothetical protein